MLNRCWPTINRYEIGPQMQRSYGDWQFLVIIDSQSHLSLSVPSRGLLRDCEIFANIRLKLYCQHYCYLAEVPCLPWSQLHCRPRDCCWLCGGRGGGRWRRTRPDLPHSAPGPGVTHPAVPSHAPGPCTQQSAVSIAWPHAVCSLTLLSVFRHKSQAWISPSLLHSDAWELWNKYFALLIIKSWLWSISVRELITNKMSKNKSKQWCRWPLYCNWRVSGSPANLSATANWARAPMNSFPCICLQKSLLLFHESLNGSAQCSCINEMLNLFLCLKKYFLFKSFYIFAQNLWFLSHLWS